MRKNERAIDILRRSNGRADLVEKAVRIHRSCKTCKGCGGSFHPEQECSECGFNVFDSCGVESIEVDNDY